MDEIVNRVVDQLRDAGVDDDGDDENDGTEIEVRSGDEADLAVGEADDEFGDDEGGFGDGREDDSEADLEGGEAEIDDGTAGDHGVAEGARREDASRRREEARARKREAKRRAREAREAAAGLEDLGDRIEAAVEAQLSHLGEHIEHAIAPGPAEPPGPTVPGVVLGPDETREKAVYKTQLQKGGRVAVPDTEIEALGLEPGDTLQVVLYPVE